MRKIIYFSLIIPLLATSVSTAFPKNLPMKPSSAITIPDGEFLKYGNYHGEEKNQNYYFITRIITNTDGDLCYHIYFDIVPVIKKPPQNYLKWPASFIVDIKLGSVIESEGLLDSETTKDWGKGGRLIYWHYFLNVNKGEAEYTSRMLSGAVTNESRAHSPVREGFPSVEMWAGVAFIPRFLNVDSGGIYFSVMPDLIKSPMPITWQKIAEGNLRTPAGSFKTFKYRFYFADPFLGRLMDPFLEGSGAYVEDSERKLVVRNALAGGYILLEEVSNINRIK